MGSTFLYYGFVNGSYFLNLQRRVGQIVPLSLVRNDGRGTENTPGSYRESTVRRSNGFC